MDGRVRDSTRRTTPGRWIVAAIVGLGATMGLVGLVMRGGRGPSLPLKPGAIVFVVGDAAPVDDANATRFDFAIAPSTELAANLGSLLVGKMPREHGLVRAGERLRTEVPTLAEIAAGQGFATAAFLSTGNGAATASPDWKGSGLLRGFVEVFAEPGKTDRDVGARAADWLAARGNSPSFALVWLAPRDFLLRLRESGVAGHAAIVLVGGLDHGGRVALTLRLPVSILPNRVDARPVSLIDVVPSVCELFGVRAPDSIGPPFLLDPHWPGPRFVLATRPLAGALADADDVWLYAKGVAYVNAPSRGRPDEIDAIVRGDAPFEGPRPVDHSPALAADFRKVIADGFGYRFDEMRLAEVVRSAGATANEGQGSPDAPARAWVARFAARVDAH